MKKLVVGLAAGVLLLALVVAMSGWASSQAAPAASASGRPGLPANLVDATPAAADCNTGGVQESAPAAAKPA